MYARGCCGVPAPTPSPHRRITSRRIISRPVLHSLLRSQLHRLAMHRLGASVTHFRMFTPGAVIARDTI
jgi:hypothetical protein